MKFKECKGVIFPEYEKKFHRYLTDEGQYQKFQIDIAMMLDSSRRNCAIDVGAHVGLISGYLGQKYKTILAFEPSSANRTCFSQNTKNRGNIILFPYALGMDTKIRSLLIHPDNSGGNSLEPTYCENAKISETVEVRTLDSLIGSNQNFGNIDLIKIDVQGSETAVLKGSIETIKAHKPLIIYEAETKAVGTDDEKRKDTLEALGYKMVAKIVKERIFIHKTKIDKNALKAAQAKVEKAKVDMKEKRKMQAHSKH